MDPDPPHRPIDRRRLLVLAGSAALVAFGADRLRPRGGDAEVVAEPPGRGDPDLPTSPDRPARRGSADPPLADEVAPDRSGARRGDPEPDAEEAVEPEYSDAPGQTSEPDPGTDPQPEPDPGPESAPDPGPQPQEWGERVTGVRTRLATSERRVALTFDGCGGPNGGRVDTALLDHLADLAVPATLFLNASWIEANRSLSRELAREPRYELTGRAPRWFRSGTAYVDEVAVGIVRALGLEVVNYDVLGDAGATFTPAQVEQALLGARPGSIALLHLNHPGSGTAAGVAAAVPARLGRSAPGSDEFQHGVQRGRVGQRAGVDDVRHLGALEQPLDRELELLPADRARDRGDRVELVGDVAG